MNSYEVILFDLDGTLTDPKVGITKSIQYALRKYDIHVEDLDTLIPFIGPPLADSFQEYYGFSREEALRAIEYYREYFSVTGLYENAVYPGIPQLLEALAAKNKQLIVATSKPTVFSEKILDHFNLSKYFSLVVGSNLDGSRVVKTEIIEHIITEIACCEKRERLLMIGDRKHDIIGAQNAKVASIGVAYGYGSEEELQAANPTCIARTVEELKKILLE
jgi:phosphoglycolate phosphatase